MIICLLLVLFTESSLHEFCSLYNLNSLCNEATSYKLLEKASCIDILLTSSPRSFQNNQTIETGLSDFEGLIVTVLKIHFQIKINPK